jgi:hypothetical protein
MDKATFHAEINQIVAGHRLGRHPYVKLVHEVAGLPMGTCGFEVDATQLGRVLCRGNRAIGNF